MNATKHALAYVRLEEGVSVNETPSRIYKGSSQRYGEFSVEFWITESAKDDSREDAKHVLSRVEGGAKNKKFKARKSVLSDVEGSEIRNNFK